MATAPLALPRAARIACLLVLGMVAPHQAGLAVPPGAGTPALGDEAYLDRLVGHWRMEGTVRGKPVAYRAEGERVLQGAFLRLHLIDVAEPPQYEADVFIGLDAKAHDWVAHWLDRFGAAGARVVATGRRDGERVILNFPYAKGAFRATFTLEPRSGTWTLLLEAQAASGAWSTFARYTLVPAPRP